MHLKKKTLHNLNLGAAGTDLAESLRGGQTCISIGPGAICVLCYSIPV